MPGAEGYEQKPVAREPATFTFTQHITQRAEMAVPEVDVKEPAVAPHTDITGPTRDIRGTETRATDSKSGPEYSAPLVSNRWDLVPFVQAHVAGFTPERANKMDIVTPGDREQESKLIITTAMGFTTDRHHKGESIVVSDTLGPVDTDAAQREYGPLLNTATQNQVLAEVRPVTAKSIVKKASPAELIEVVQRALPSHRVRTGDSELSRAEIDHVLERAFECFGPKYDPSLNDLKEGMQILRRGGVYSEATLPGPIKDKLWNGFTDSEREHLGSGAIMGVERYFAMLARTDSKQPDEMLTNRNFVPNPQGSVIVNYIPNNGFNHEGTLDLYEFSTALGVNNDTTGMHVTRDTQLWTKIDFDKICQARGISRISLFNPTDLAPEDWAHFSDTVGVMGGEWNTIQATAISAAVGEKTGWGTTGRGRETNSGHSVEKGGSISHSGGSSFSEGFWGSKMSHSSEESRSKTWGESDSSGWGASVQQGYLANARYLSSDTVLRVPYNHLRVVDGGLYNINPASALLTRNAEALQAAQERAIGPGASVPDRITRGVVHIVQPVTHILPLRRR